MSLPPILTTTEEVVELVAMLQAETVIAVDLEADSMHNYQEKVCLLQFSTRAATVLLDPLDGADLSALKPVMADPDVRKIFTLPIMISAAWLVILILRSTVYSIP